MPKSTSFIADVHNLVARGTVPGWNANGNLFMSLHTGSPGVGGNQTTSEATYTGYARVAISRDVAGMLISGGQISNAALVQFGACTSGTNALTHYAIGTDASGTGQVLYFEALTTSFTVTAPIQPQFGTSTMTITEA
jgi:hypothetical protein